MWKFWISKTLYIISCIFCFRVHFVKMHDAMSRNQRKKLEKAYHFCQECGKAFLNASALTNHIRCKHSGDPKFPCLYCPKVFLRECDRYAQAGGSKVYSLGVNPVTIPRHPNFLTLTRNRHTRDSHKDPNLPLWAEEKERRRSIVAAAAVIAQTETASVVNLTEDTSSAATLAAIMETDALGKAMAVKNQGGGDGEAVGTDAEEGTPGAADRPKTKVQLSVSENLIPCPACLNAFQVSLLKSHITRSHPDLDPDTEFLKNVFKVGKNFQCVECGKTFVDRHVMKTHVESVHMGYRYECELVGRT